jgi:hypothetical protein
MVVLDKIVELDFRGILVAILQKTELEWESYDF